MQSHVREFATLSHTTPTIDVRSPSEYARGHVPGAHSLPLFSDEERHIVGSAYALEGRDEAVKIGLSLVGPRLRELCEAAESIAPGRRIAVYCWRGGMRSNSVSWLLRTCGFETVTLRGGYKEWRRLALASFEQRYPFIVLGGTTGSGKTELLAALRERGEAVVDLEHAASHRGSAFGGIGLGEQPTQEQFENRVAMELLRYPEAPHIWLEDESRRIGKVILPKALWEQLWSSPVVHVDLQREERVRRLVRDYGAFATDELGESLQRIGRRLGHEKYSRALEALALRDMATVAEMCLDYYDKYYLRAIRDRDANPVMRQPATAFDADHLCTVLQDAAREILRA